MNILAASILLLCAGQDRKPSPLVGPIEVLWPKGAPGALGTEERDKPNLSLYLAPEGKADGAAVVVCPGGGYQTLARDHEGHQIGVWLNALGVHAFVLTYRHAPHFHIYEKGPHGFGLGNDKNPELKSWPERLAAWLGVRGILKEIRR
jgi:hypothetical protein